MKFVWRKTTLEMHSCVESNCLPSAVSWFGRVAVSSTHSSCPFSILFVLLHKNQLHTFHTIHYIFSGQAKVISDPFQHSTQYSHYYPLPNIEDLKKEEARESLRRYIEHSLCYWIIYKQECVHSTRMPHSNYHFLCSVDSEIGIRNLIRHLN